MTNHALNIDQQKLVDAWNRTMPEVLNSSDKAEVFRDVEDANAVRIHIKTAGRQMYSFDFKCIYVDDREVRVELVDAEKDNVSIDERDEVVQQLINDYVRHIHECAQILKTVTHA
jgi:hypothetical protein